MTVPKKAREAVKATVPDLSGVEVRRRGQKDAGGWFLSRGQVSLTGLGLGRVSRISRQAGLGERPGKLLVIPSDDAAFLYLVPVKDHPQAVEVKYTKSTASFNLSALFAYLGYSLVPGSREFHRVEFSDEAVEVDGVELPALKLYMKVEETRWAKSETEKRKAEAEKAAKEAAEKAAAAKAAPAQS